jgi:porphobilinogen synthase
MRRLVRETRVSPSQLVWPLFVGEWSEPAPLDSLPGQFTHSLDSVARAAESAAEAGLGGLMLFGVPDPAKKDATGSQAIAAGGVLNRAIGRVRDAVGDDLVIMADTCLDAFTDHGHCGVLRDGEVDNDATVELYARQAVAQATAGAHMVGPSGMMDGQVAAIRAGLDEAGFTDTGIIAYAAKYAASFYGPFRDAMASSLEGDRRTYQQDPANRREGVLEARLDEAEGADILMVKPAGYYLDVLADVARASSVPVAAYQVSGEYAMIKASAERGWIDEEAAFVETVTAIVRAGADIVLTYAAPQLVDWLEG